MTSLLEVIISLLLVAVEEAESSLPVDSATQQLIQSVLSEEDQAAVTELEAVSQQCDQLHTEINQLAA